MNFYNFTSSIPLYASALSSQSNSLYLYISSIPLLLSPYVSNLTPKQLFLRLSSSLVNFNILLQLANLIGDKKLRHYLEYTGTINSNDQRINGLNGLERIVLEGPDFYGPLMSYLSLAIAIVLQFPNRSITMNGTVLSSILVWSVVSWAIYYFVLILWLERRRMQWYEVVCLVGYQLFSVFIINGVLGAIISWESVWLFVALVLGLSSTWSFTSVLKSESDEMVIPISGSSREKNGNGSLFVFLVVGALEFSLCIWLRYIVALLF